MLKTYVASPTVGAIAAILGWLAAVIFKDTMTEQAFADLRFGWAGAMVGCVAATTLALIWYFTRKSIEPLVTAVCAAIGAAILWDRQELPFARGGFEQASNRYWTTVTMMAIIFVLLLLGLRAARESNSRAR